MRKNNGTRRLLTASAVLVAGAMLWQDAAVAQPATHNTSARVGGDFQIVNGQTGKCATVAGGVSTANNVELVQFTCDKHPSRRWILTNFNGSSYQIVNVQTRKCATVAGGVSTANNVELVQFTCDTHPSRRWILSYNGSSYQIVNAQTRKCMTVAGGVSTANNVELVQFTCDTHASRRWTLRRIGVPID
ncbi:MULTISPECIES: RICIN domain-containing protein [unclassified Streptomyces]|uniref:RICIN domain-containing protein n=1 Tax=unclassified Streptomyces TaxID=2593676 RepID=UPI002E0D90CA|nr:MULTISPECIES: RICIN domain-containing protein [unclassified Streptomyces]WSR23465.1 RICIN domain-containing protein [Streptomyces sp. NBC_01205]